MTHEYATGNGGHPLPLRRSTAFNPDLEEPMNGLQFCTLYYIRRASTKPAMSLQLYKSLSSLINSKTFFHNI